VTPGPAPQYSPAHEHLEPIVPGARIPEPRARHRGSIPLWPSTMIAPSESELARWAELWRNPQATQWGQAGHEHAVANLVRAELRLWVKATVCLGSGRGESPARGAGAGPQLAGGCSLVVVVTRQAAPNEGPIDGKEASR
jgi:hypothetical protein